MRELKELIAAGRALQERWGKGNLTAAMQTLGAALDAAEDAEPRRVVLVYQAGIANVFEVDCFNLSDYGRNARRLVQGDFRTCEAFARGCGAMGARVRSAGCNLAGDITAALWSEDLGPFRSSARPVNVPIGSALTAWDEDYLGTCGGCGFSTADPAEFDRHIAQAGACGQ